MIRYLLPLLLLAGCSGCVTIAPESLRSTTLRLEFERGLCSGTAVGLHKILTAQHCLTMGGALKSANGKPVVVLNQAKSGRDTLWLDVDARFTHVAEVNRHPQPKQGDRVRWWGNPEGNPDVFRMGYVARATDGLLVIDGTICHGDSGAALFDDEGLVIGVVSAMSDQSGCTFLLAGAP